ncbi:MAG TPA: peptide MFS transporter [Pyrinomonadaceae bacterium]|nr:peptide MFS transporter [Pyrinomonadaceae bacterium]
MATQTTPPLTELEEGNIVETPDFAGHPRGLPVLFFTELWERFSYYGMRSILILYMTSAAAQGGLGFSVKDAASIYGTYTMSVYLTAVPGGLIADYLTGARLAVFLGGVIIAAGHFSMVFRSMTTFYLGLILISVGTGLLKPNISTMVGGLYRQNDPRRDSGFSIFYMGINLGSVLAGFIVGYLAKGVTFKNFLASIGQDPNSSWHYGFGAAGVGMVLGLVIYLLNQRKLKDVGNKIPKASKNKSATETVVREPLTRDDWKRIAAIFIFFLFTILFWGAYEQKGASLNLFADRLVRAEIFGMSFPVPFLQSLTGIFVIILAPIFSFVWIRMKDRQPSSPGKFALGLVFIGLAFMLLVPASLLTADGKVTFWWLVGLYFLAVCGEMCLSPVGLSTVTKLAPIKLVGIMMGVWFLAASFGNKLAGYLSGFFVSNDPVRLATLYGGIAVGLLVSAGVLALFTPSIKKMMGKVV